MAATATEDRVVELLGDDAETLLSHTSTTIDRSLLHLPGPDFVDRIYADMPTATQRPCATSSRSSTTGGLPAPVT